MNRNISPSTLLTRFKGIETSNQTRESAILGALLTRFKGIETGWKNRSDNWANVLLTRFKGIETAEIYGKFCNIRVVIDPI